MMLEMIEISECICCGKDYPKLSPTKIEGALIDVCDRCTRFGTKSDF